MDAREGVWSLFLLLACTSTAAPSGADAGTVVLLSEAEWQALIAPRPGVHEVWSAACNGVRIGQEYRVRPALICEARRYPDSDTIDCRIGGNYCETSADCTAKPGGVCRGSSGSSCEYASLQQQPCDQDAECTQLPEGRCMSQLAAGRRECFPTGECTSPTPVRSCVYPSQFGNGCLQDADCAAAPGGHCRRGLATTCEYNECDGDSCGPTARCECQYVRTCVAADCFSDAECGAGFRCEGSLALECGNLYPPVGYHCHTERDECQSDADCGTQSCVFDPALSRWSCRTFDCLTR